MGQLTALDIIVLALVMGGAVLGFMRGLVQELTSLLAWVLAIVAVRFLHAPVNQWLTPWVGTEGGAAVLAFLLLFVGVFLLTRWASRKMGRHSRDSLIGGFDRGLGAGFGAVKGLLMATLLFMLATLLYDVGYGYTERPVWLKDSRTHPALNAMSQALSKVIAERQAAARSAEAAAANGQ